MFAHVCRFDAALTSCTHFSVDRTGRFTVDSEKRNDRVLQRNSKQKSALSFEARYEII